VIEVRVVGSFVADPNGAVVKVCAEHVPLASAKVSRDPAASLLRLSSLRALAEHHGAGTVELSPRRPS
jgi:hypothetical protein